MKILLIAGEESGDIYAGRLVKSLVAQNAEITVEGIGGSRMRAAGATTLYDIKKISSMGLGSAIGTLKVFFRALKDIKARIGNGEYDAVILIDYPDFNLRVAKAAKKANVPVFYYVSPQFWAWRTYRANAVRKYVDMMIPAFSFEVEFYKQRGVDANFLGHPILDELDPPKEKGALRQELGLPQEKLILGILPGSREKEVERMLGLMIDAVKIIRKDVELDLVVSCADSVDEASLGEAINEMGESATIIKGKSWEVMCATDFLICKSGTSTLQAAIAGAPMVIVYKVDAFSYFMAKSLTHVKWAGLPNLFAGKEVAPELLQGAATPETIAEKTLPYLLDNTKLHGMRDELLEIGKSLGKPGAANRAASAILGFLAKIEK